MENRSFYNEILTEHNLHPEFKHDLPDADIVLEGVNPSCGDDIFLMFIDRRFQAGENPEDYVFIPAKVTDNRALLRAQPDYLRQLQALPRRLRDAWLDGKWDVFQGQVFQEFTNDPAHYQDRRFTHVIAPFDIPQEWRVYRSYDFGYAKPFSCGWWAVDHDGVIYRILELYGCTGEADVGVRWTPER